MSTGFCISAIITIFLNLILPKDEDTEEIAQQELDTPELSEVVHVHES